MNTFACLVEYNPVKQEVSCTMILPLWCKWILSGYYSYIHLIDVGNGPLPRQASQIGGQLYTITSP